jgi:hypothetical protein
MSLETIGHEGTTVVPYEPSLDNSCERLGDGRDAVVRGSACQKTSSPLGCCPCTRSGGYILGGCEPINHPKLPEQSRKISGATVLSLLDSRAAGLGILEPYLPLTATPHRNAIVPTLFAFPEQQPVSFTPKGAAPAAEAAPPRLWAAFAERNPDALTDTRPVLVRYDCRLVIGRHRFRLAEDPGLVAIDATSTFQLIAIDHSVLGP